jgi:hypothetical protein
MTSIATAYIIVECMQPSTATGSCLRATSLAASAAWSIVKPRVIWQLGEHVRTMSAVDRSPHPEKSTAGHELDPHA